MLPARVSRRLPAQVHVCTLFRERGCVRAPVWCCADGSRVCGVGVAWWQGKEWTLAPELVRKAKRRIAMFGFAQDAEFGSHARPLQVA